MLRLGARLHEGDLLELGNYAYRMPPMVVIYLENMVTLRLWTVCLHSRPLDISSQICGNFSNEHSLGASTPIDGRIYR